MRSLYLDLGMGAAGDMLTAALLELLPAKEKYIDKLNDIGIPGVSFSAEASRKCGIVGTHVSVMVNGVEELSEDCGTRHTHFDSDCDGYGDNNCDGHRNDETHRHSSLQDIEHICSHLNVPPNVKKDIAAIYRIIAEAESYVHGTAVSQIHFHEVGQLDAIADITAVCVLLDEISPDEIIASPVNTGFGQVRCAHGIVPVPAPATTHILKGVPIYGGDIRGELCTPTGAAILKHFVNRFGSMPIMEVAAIGYGMGTKNFEAANCVRAMLGVREAAEACDDNDGNDTDFIYELSCNVDDMTGECIGFATEKLLEAGARDVFTVNIGMKKSRPGLLLKVICDEAHRERIVRDIFKHTTTIGIREQKMKRYILERHTETEDTPLGPIAKKTASGYGVTRCKYEYDDLAAAANREGVSIREVIEMSRNGGSCEALHNTNCEALHNTNCD